jgi:outer membrane receptor protein involved in Fe transport
MNFRLSLEANNMFDQQYDVIANYPMPGRNFALGLEMMF